MSWRRVLACGLLTAAAAGLAGGVLERWWFGPTDATAAARVEVLVRREFDRMAGVLTTIASGIATDPVTIEGLTVASDAQPRLFDLLANVREAAARPDDVAITVYDSLGVARAWSGRPSEVESARTVGGEDLFVTRSVLGLRLVHVHPIVIGDGRTLGSIASEHVLLRATAGAAIAPGEDLLPTRIAPVSFLPRAEGGGERLTPGSFLLNTPSGALLVEASVSAADLRLARAQWRRTVVAWVLVIAGVTLILLIGPLLDLRLSAKETGAFVLHTLIASLLLVGGIAVIWFGLAWLVGGRLALPANLAFIGIALAALIALWTVPAVRLQVAYRARRRALSGARVAFVLTQLVAGTIVAALFVAFALVLAVALDPAAVDVRLFSLYPWDASRVLRVVGILALHVAAVWGGALTLIAARGPWRLPRRAPGVRVWLMALWVLPTAATALFAAGSWSIPVAALVISASTCAITALLARRVVTWYRHATVASRIFALFLAFLVPAVLLYPSLDFFAERSIQRVISGEYAINAQNHSRVLLERLREAEKEIDAFPGLADLLSANDTESTGSPVADRRAFDVWRRTVLARDRLTSAVELYNRYGQPISRFGLYLPEYTGSGQQPQPISSCKWDDPFAEPLPIGSDERPVLHAERGICSVDEATGEQILVGTIIMHVALDFRTLPFITSQSPYFELFRPREAQTLPEVSRGNDLQVVIYGWGLQPLYSSGLSSWAIGDSLFQRLYDTERKPFWETLPLAGSNYRVYFTNDRARIYAIGYPLPTLFDHFVHFAELTTLAGVVFALALIGTAIFTRISREQPRVGRALLREIRASFYRKLFLAFVLASTIPVLLLALGIRAYFADLLLADIQSEATRTAAVAQRVIQESDAFIRRGAEGAGPLSDDVMIWIRQVIDQDVNVFEGPELKATSERDLFQSGLLPTRTPDAVYRAVALQRLPNFVDEDLLGTFSYLIAAAPLRVNGRDFVLTVPLAARQQEIERQKFELDRGVHLAVLCFILLGAAIGLSLAERIADPVRRLTRATQRIARGDFDARIAVRSVDELRRLVDAFNSMAGELKAQRIELERTHRLEAWAEMARQVAHEIKNPLTPIQLSAEHLRRVHEDQGQPLGPVLEGCVDSILGQVRLLRQIASEFSSFASAPRAKAAPVDVPELIAEIMNPYRAGLAGRIEIQNRVTAPLPQVLVDRTLVLRALANIVENALHAMPGQGRLIVEASSDAEFVTVAVQDTGVGMDEDALARAFEPYFSTKTSGTGLGLPIAKRNIELNGGHVDLTSRKGEGTTVRVRLPIVR